jgi:hypothetical protein
LVDKSYSIGTYSLAWEATNDNGSSVASGMYFYIIKADNLQISKKMILIK